MTASVLFAKSLLDLFQAEKAILCSTTAVVLFAKVEATSSLDFSRAAPAITNYFLAAIVAGDGVTLVVLLAAANTLRLKARTMSNFYIFD